MRMFTCRIVILAVIACGVVSAQSNDSPPEGISPDHYLLDLKILHFVEDMVHHDFRRLFLALDPQYVDEQRHLMDAFDEGLTPEIFDTLFFGGAAMYEDYTNTIGGLIDVADVLGFAYEPWDELLRLFVLLTDGREVEFTLIVDPSTLLFYGPFG